MRLLKEADVRRFYLDSTLGETALVVPLYLRHARVIRDIVKAVPHGKRGEARLQKDRLASRKCAALPRVDREQMALN